MQFYVKYAKINLVTIWKSKEIHFKSWRVILQDNIKEENKMAARRTEKQKMLRQYEKEMEEKRKAEELRQRQEEEAERLAYDIKLHRELEEEEEIKKMRRLFVEEAYRMDFATIW